MSVSATVNAPAGGVSNSHYPGVGINEALQTLAVSEQQVRTNLSLRLSL